jgi:hypothetical protein
MAPKRTTMAEALSHAAGHAYSRMVPTEIPEMRAEAAPPVPPIAVMPRPTVPSRIGKKPITGFFDPAVSRQIKKLGLDQDKTMQEILQEAFNDLFRKYDLPPIA